MYKTCWILSIAWCNPYI